MCFEAMRWAISQKLPHIQKIVLIVIADCKNHENGDCFPSFDFLADACGMSRRSIIRQVSCLNELGYIGIKKRVNKNNQYLLNIPGGSDRESPVIVTESHHGSDRESPMVVTESHHGSDRESPVVVTESHPNQEYITLSSLPAREAVDNFSMPGDMQQCFQWAKVHPFWADVVTSLSKFILLYNANAPNGVRSQFQKREQNISEHGNDFNLKRVGRGGTYKQNFRRLSVVERVREANGLPINEWEDQAG